MPASYAVVHVGNSYVKSYIKDPTARLGYTWDWSDWLAAASDTISSVTVSVPDGLTAVGTHVVDGAFVTQRVEGGTLENVYRMACRITTAGGLIEVESIYLTIREK